MIIWKENTYGSGIQRINCEKKDYLATIYEVVTQATCRERHQKDINQLWFLFRLFSPGKTKLEDKLPPLCD
jgi:hypothetical protein